MAQWLRACGLVFRIHIRQLAISITRDTEDLTPSAGFLQVLALTHAHTYTHK